MAHALTATEARSRWAELFRRAVVERHPVTIERGRSERALLIGLEDFERLLSRHDFHPETFWEESAVSIWLPELCLYGRGPTFEEAQEDLLSEVRDYADEYLEEAQLYLRSPNRAEQFPFVMKALVADALGRLEDVLFASPSAP